jgi:choline dehydrogenase-like flavoprotein
MSDLVAGERPGLTLWEQALRAAAAFLALISTGFAVWYLAKGLFDRAEYPYVVNSVAKDALLAGLALLVFWDVRRWSPIAVPLIVAAHVLMPVAMVLTAIFGNAKGIDNTWIGPPDSPSAFRLGWIASDIAVVVAFVGLSWMATRSRYDLRYLPPSAFRALMALAEVLVLRKDRDIAPAEVAGRVDHYLGSFRAHEKWKMRLGLVALAYWPLLTLRPPFHVMSRDTRQRWIQRRFLDEVSDRLVPEWLRSTRQAMIRVAQQLCFLGYYGDERAAQKAGYVPFSRREGFERAMKRVEPDRSSVTCIAPAEIPGEDLTADVVIVGTGAAGATLAYEFALRGREVLMLERGAHVKPAEFTENEATQLSNLYADGALTLSKDFRFQVAQGMCVGGSTVVNNAVCIAPEARTLERWLDPDGLDAGLDRQRLDRAFERVRRFLRVTDAGPATVPSPGAARIIQGFEKAAGPATRVVDCNIADCLGCGYCNIGCAYGKKLSALDWALPRAQEDFPGAVRILPECRVEKVLMRDARAYGVRARLGDGRRLTVRAGTVVLSAGAIASSTILQRSGLGDGRAGRGLAFNMGSPVTLDFAEEIHAERGVQITHFWEPSDGDHEGLAFETWFNPIVTQSLFMPGWFEEHWDNMRRYAHMTCIGVVVGTGNDGSVTSAWPGRGPKLDYTPSDDDLVKLKEGLRLACQAGLQAGAERVMPSTFRMIEIRSERDLSRIHDEIGDGSDVNLNSSHPQGGNPISDDPLKGVVDPSFRVYGTLNVYVCDASVFPSSITVNPQLTVMALAAYAADEIAGGVTAPAQPRASSSQTGGSGPGSYAQNVPVRTQVRR